MSALKPAGSLGSLRGNQAKPPDSGTCTLEQFLMILLDGKSRRAELSEAFLLVYPTFIAPNELWLALETRLRAVGDDPQLEAKTIAFVLQWLSLVEDDYESSVLKDVEQYVLHHRGQRPALASLMRPLTESILRSSAVNRTRPVKPPTRIDNLFDIPVDKVAQQLYLIDLKFLREVHFRELLSTAWLDNNRLQPSTPGLDLAVKRSKEVTAWVASNLLTGDKNGLPRRMEWFIRLADACKRLGDLSACVDLVWGLKDRTFTRLKQEKNLSAEVQALLSSMWELASTRKGWQSLRAMYMEKPTNIPFIGSVIEHILSVRKARAPDGQIEPQCVTELHAIVLEWRKHQAAVPPSFPAEDQLQLGLYTIGSKLLTPVERMASSCFMQPPAPNELSELDTSTCAEIMHAYLRKAAKFPPSTDIRGPALNPWDGEFGYDAAKNHLLLSALSVSLVDLSVAYRAMQAQKGKGPVLCTITALGVQEERISTIAAKLGITINIIGGDADQSPADGGSRRETAAATSKWSSWSDFFTKCGLTAEQASNYEKQMIGAKVALAEIPTLTEDRLKALGFKLGPLGKIMAAMKTMDL